MIERTVDEASRMNGGIVGRCLAGPGYAALSLDDPCGAVASYQPGDGIDAGFLALATREETPGHWATLRTTGYAR